MFWEALNKRVIKIMDIISDETITPEQIETHESLFDAWEAIVIATDEELQNAGRNI